MPHKTLEARHAYREKNQERIRMLVRQWRANNLERCREYDRKRDRREYKLMWSRKHPEAVRAKSAEYRKKNPEKVKAAIRKWYLKNRKKSLAASKANYQANKSEWYKRVRDWKAKNPEKEKAYQAKWASENRESILSRMRNHMNERYASNPDEFRARAVSYYHRNKEKLKIKRRSVSVHRAAMIRKYTNERNATIRLGSSPEGSGQIVELIFQLKASPETKCFYCGSPLFGNVIHIDHIVPLSKGGSHCVSNLCAACPPCNLSKNNKTIDEWNQWKHAVKSRCVNIEGN